MKFLHELKTISITVVLTSLVSGLATVSAAIWLAIRDPLANIVLQHVPKSLLLILPLLLLLLLISSVSYIFFLRKKLANKLFSACDVYWDKDFNPHCPSCQKLLSNYNSYEIRTHDFRPGYFCVSCKEKVFLSDGEKMYININEAKEKAKEIYNGNMHLTKLDLRFNLFGVSLKKYL